MARQVGDYCAIKLDVIATSICNEGRKEQSMSSFPTSTIRREK